MRLMCIEIFLGRVYILHVVTICNVMCDFWHHSQFLHTWLHSTRGELSRCIFYNIALADKILLCRLHVCWESVLTTKYQYFTTKTLVRIPALVDICVHSSDQLSHSLLQVFDISCYNRKGNVKVTVLGRSARSFWSKHFDHFNKEVKPVKYIKLH